MEAAEQHDFDLEVQATVGLKTRFASGLFTQASKTAAEGKLWKHGESRLDARCRPVRA